MGTMQDHQRLNEAAMEQGLVAALAASPLYTARDPQHFDPATLLDADLLWDFIAATQPRELSKLRKQFPDAPREALAGHVAGLIQKRGTLDVLRNGVSFSGVNLQLAYFRPAAGGNQEHQARYESNRFAVMRQVHFSTRTPDQSVDVVILLNGLPIVSVELKNHFTSQNVQHAIAQYRRRDKNEPIWKRGLVHFAVDDDAAYMSTQIVGQETAFLPFNRRRTPTGYLERRFAPAADPELSARRARSQNRSGKIHLPTLSSTDGGPQVAESRQSPRQRP